MKNHKCLVGLDIGTTKIAAVVGERDDTGQVKITGVGHASSDGLRKGIMVNLDKTVQAITKAVDVAALMSGAVITEVYPGIAGDHIRSINSRGVIAVASRNNEISQKDIQRVIDAAQAISLPSDREILHVLPQQYIVDDQDSIKEPIGIKGVRLEVDAHIVTAGITSTQNIYQAIDRAGLKVLDPVLEALATSYAVLSEDEQELGVGVLDMGGGTTDLSILSGGCIRHTAIIGLGGDNITNDITIGLRTPLEQAEQLKVTYGCTYFNKVREEEVLEVPGVGGRETRLVARSVLAGVIQPRVEEILLFARQEFQKSQFYEHLTTGIVLTGGCALLEGIAELAEEIFDMPVKIGVPSGFHGMVSLAQNPMYATAVGLILYGAYHQEDDFAASEKAAPSVMNHSLHRVGKWIKNFL